MTLALEIEKEKKISKMEGKIETIRDMIKAGLFTVADIKASSLYSEQELEAIMAPQ